MCPAQAVVTVGMPDSYVWDGVEYVGVVGDRYMCPLAPVKFGWFATPSVSTAFTGGKGAIRNGAEPPFAMPDQTRAGKPRRGRKREKTKGGSSIMSETVQEIKNLPRRFGAF